MESHLLQMRGLKLNMVQKMAALIMSHLLQMRGLKLGNTAYVRYGIVASFTDAWIETRNRFIIFLSPSVASFTDAWIETFEEISHIV